MAYCFQRGGAWYAGFRDDTGRQVRVVTRARTLTEARRLAEDLERRAERIRLGLEARPVPDIPYREGVARYLASLPQEYASRPHLEGRFRNRILPHLGDRLIRSITSADVLEMLRKNEDASPQTREHLRVAVQGSYTWLVEHAGLAQTNPAAKVPRVEIPQRLPKFLRKEEIPRLLAEIPKQWLVATVVALGTAVRKAELLAIPKANVLLEEEVLIIDRTLTRPTTKAGKERRIPIPPALIPVLREQLRTPGPMLFPNPSGGQWSRHVKVHDIIRRALCRAGLVDGWAVACKSRGSRQGCGFEENRHELGSLACPKCGNTMRAYPQAKPIRWKELRSTWATHAAAQSRDIRFVQVVLGHGDPKVTAVRYAHALPEHLREQMGRINLPGRWVGETPGEAKRTQAKRSGRPNRKGERKRRDAKAGKEERKRP